jgi:hypothetical protein
VRRFLDILPLLILAAAVVYFVIAFGDLGLLTQ